jgi:hypothetical protein
MGRRSSNRRRRFEPDNILASWLLGVETAGLDSRLRGDNGKEETRNLKDRRLASDRGRIQRQEAKKPRGLSCFGACGTYRKPLVNCRRRFEPGNPSASLLLCGKINPWNALLRSKGAA